MSSIMPEEVAKLQEQVEMLKASNQVLQDSFQQELKEAVDQERRRIVAEAAEFNAVSMATKKVKVDVAKPDIFDGSESKFHSFLHQLSLLFWASPTQYADDDNRITCALSYMKGGRAEAWARSFIDKHNDRTSYDYTWVEFKDLLAASFGAADPTANAVDKLYKLEQGSMTADEYIVTFEEYAGYTGWDDKALMDQFEKGLKSSLTASIYRLENMPTTLQGWKQWARKLDRQWRLYEEKQKGLKPQKSTTSAAPGAASQVAVAKPTFSGGSGRRDGTGYTFGGNGQPMDIDGARSRITCFVCGNKGHIARLCPNKICGNAQHVRAVLSNQEITELLRLIQDEPVDKSKKEDFVEQSQ